MAATVNYFHTYDQLALYFTAVLVEPDQASIVFVHGVGEHIGRYAEAFQIFSQQGYSCFGFDQRGFGRSEGERGHINAFSDYVDDLAKFIDEIVRPESSNNIFILGHSMGSIVELAYAEKYPTKIQGLLIFSCPLIFVSNAANFGNFIAQGLAIVMPELKLPNLIDPQALSDNTANIQAFSVDPCAFKQVSVNWVHEFKLARVTVLEDAGQIVMPVLINHGEADTIAAVSGAQALFEALGSRDKILKCYPGLKHELLNHCPAARAKVLEQTFEWLKRQNETRTS